MKLYTGRKNGCTYTVMMIFLCERFFLPQFLLCQDFMVFVAYFTAHFLSLIHVWTFILEHTGSFAQNSFQNDLLVGTKHKNYCSLSLPASLDTQQILRGGIIVEWDKVWPEIPVCGRHFDSRYLFTIRFCLFTMFAYLPYLLALSVTFWCYPL